LSGSLLVVRDRSRWRSVARLQVIAVASRATFKRERQSAGCTEYPFGTTVVPDIAAPPTDHNDGVGSSDRLGVTGRVPQNVSAERRSNSPQINLIYV
jgi:hypothetical protein